MFLDGNADGELNSGEDVLCIDPSIGSDDVGTCEFNVTHPTFRSGADMNMINAVDGRDGYVSKYDGKVLDLPKFELKASISASPKGGSPGEIIQIQVVDFPPNTSISLVQISRTAVSGGGATDSTGAESFQITIPNWVKAGAQELRVTANKVDAAGDNVRASTVIDLLGPQINVTPGTVLANQRISLVGSGFSPGAVIANDTDDEGNHDSYNQRWRRGNQQVAGSTTVTRCAWTTVVTGLLRLTCR